MIIGLSGYARSGKDTVAELLVLNYGFKRVAFADGIRDALIALNPILHDGHRLNEVVQMYGWDVAKAKDEVRRLLQVMGTEVGRKLIHEDVRDTFYVGQSVTIANSGSLYAGTKTITAVGQYSISVTTTHSTAQSYHPIFPYGTVSTTTYTDWTTDTAVQNAALMKCLYP